MNNHYANAFLALESKRIELIALQALNLMDMSLEPSNTEYQKNLNKVEKYFKDRKLFITKK